MGKVPENDMVHFVLEEVRRTGQAGATEVLELTRFRGHLMI